MDLKDFQQQATTTDQTPFSGSTEPTSEGQPRREQIVPLLGLVGEVGGLLGEYKKLLRDGATHRRFQDEVAEQLGDILWYVANVATKFGLDLDFIAHANLAKVRDRWLRLDGRRPLYDASLPERQQLPRRFEYEFVSSGEGGTAKVVIVDRPSRSEIGNEVSDNAYRDDGYRFHDVMHLTFAACLGWSPVLRKMLRVAKRIENRTPLKTDEVEDGGRAQVIEEALVAAAYVYASNHDFLDGIEAVDWQVLRHLKQMTASLEIGDRTLREWNDALLMGFRIWKQVRARGGGIVRGDLLAGTIEYASSP